MKQKWQKPVLEMLDVNMTMLGFHHGFDGLIGQTHHHHGGGGGSNDPDPAS